MYSNTVIEVHDTSKSKAAKFETITLIAHRLEWDPNCKLEVNDSVVTKVSPSLIELAVASTDGLFLV